MRVGDVNRSMDVNPAPVPGEPRIDTTRTRVTIHLSYELDLPVAFVRGMSDEEIVSMLPDAAVRSLLKRDQPTRPPQEHP